MERADPRVKFGPLLAPGEPRILPLVQFCQIRQAVYCELLGTKSRRRTWTGLSGTHYMTDVENKFWQAVECRSVAAIAPLASWSVRASFLA